MIGGEHEHHHHRRGNFGGGLARRWAKAGHTVTLDETLAETDRINVSIRQILDVQTEDGGVVLNLVELNDIQLPEMSRCPL